MCRTPARRRTRPIGPSDRPGLGASSPQPWWRAPSWCYGCRQGQRLCAPYSFTSDPSGSSIAISLGFDGVGGRAISAAFRAMAFRSASVRLRSNSALWAAYSAHFAETRIGNVRTRSPIGGAQPSLLRPPNGWQCPQDLQWRRHVEISNRGTPVLGASPHSPGLSISQR